MPTPQPAKIRSMTVKPSQSANLAFQVDGVLEGAQFTLGSQVPAFSFTDLDAHLLSHAPSDPSLLLFNSGKIAGYALPSLIFWLRAESLKAAVDSVIAARQNAYITRYKNQTAIINQLTGYFQVQHGLLTDLLSLSDQQGDALTNAYQQDGRTGVVRTTTNNTKSTTVNGGTTTSTTTGTVSGSSDMSTTTNSNTTTAGIPIVPVPNDGPPFQWGETQTYEVSEVVTQIDGSGNISTSDQAVGPVLVSETTIIPTPTQSTTSATTNVTVPNVDSYDLTVKTSYATNNVIEDQVTTNLGYDYRVPIVENKMRQARSKMSLMEEGVAAFLKSQGVNKLSTLFANELAILDANVKRTQNTYVNTLLVAPFDGQITGVFKSPGDYVRRGEPVVRLENYDYVYLVGTIIYRGLIETGTRITVTTSRFGDPTNPMTAAGTVSAVRGHRCAEDQWDVVIYCQNLYGANPSRWLFPVNYQFDFDDTTVTVG